MTPTEMPEPTVGDDGFIWSNEADASQGLREGIFSALLMLAGILGAGGLLYFREPLWLWVTGDWRLFVAGLVAFAVAALWLVRAVRSL